jgi:hypothetical protein
MLLIHADISGDILYRDNFPLARLLGISVDTCFGVSFLVSRYYVREGLHRSHVTLKHPHTLHNVRHDTVLRYMYGHLYGQVWVL